ncbi:MAG: NAD(P)-dependent oxidoreductase [Coprobacillus cateniformis]|uniref:NAD-dependent epimerase/dehydratase family protein n=1 Tax=Longibaculum muris TaxID=1796628 RepID=UPI003AB12358|nr:NAD(P)-dependent oxidoreductase [Coprobacillus cateniformis]
MERVIVTGANGFIGRNLIRELLNRNIDVTALDITFGNELKSYANVQCISCESKSIDEIYEEIKGYQYDCFFHLAWAATSGPNRADYESQLNNVKLVCDYVLLARRTGCKRFIYASSINEMETYEYMQSDDIEPGGGYIYGTAKLAGHLMGETVAYQNDIEFIPVIITNIYGAGENSARLINTSIRKLLNREHCSFTAGNQMYDFIYVTDAVNSIVEISLKGKPFHRYYIGSGKPRPLKEFLLEMRDIVAPNEELGLGDIPMKGKNISYDQFKINKVYEDTGYENKISFREGIHMTMEYIRKEGRK